MAFTVKLKSDKACFLPGDTFTLTATVEAVGGDPVPSNLTYTWTKDNKPHEGDTATLSIANATASNAGAYKITVRDADSGDEVTSDALRMDETALVVTITEPSHFYVPTHTDVVLHTKISYSGGKAPSDSYVIHYEWSKGGEDLGIQENLTIQDFSNSDNGVYTVKVWGENEASADSSSVKVMLAELRTESDVPAAKTVAIDKEILLPFSVSESVVGDSSGMPALTIKYNWYLQREGQAKPTLLGTEVGEVLEGFAIMPDGHLFKERATHDDHASFWCIAKLYQNINGATIELSYQESRKCTMTIVDSLHKMWRYVHPIPWRNTSFMYLGWWVFDEIVKFNEAGLEWRERHVYETSKYARDLETIAAAEEKYSNCICMESRNGFMYNSKEFHRLDREILEKVLRIRETPPA